MTSPSTTTRIRPSAADLDAQSPSADLVRVYLNGIGRTALLTAADEVELAKRIEAGLYASHVLATGKRLTAAKKRDLATIVREGESARSPARSAAPRSSISCCQCGPLPR